MEEPTGQTPENLQKAFGYLRNEAVDSHLAGDGMRVLHLCTIALEHLRRMKPLEGGGSVNISDVRWAFFLNLYWMLDDWIAYSIDELFKCVKTDEISSWDQKLVAFLLTTLHIPLNSAAIDELKAAPAAWLESRCESIEDLAALTLALELTWYKDCHNSDWHELASTWMSRLPSQSPLRGEVERTIERLTIQSAFYGAGALPEKNRLPRGTTSEQAGLAEAWRLFHEARFEELDAVIRQLSARVRVESPMYPALFHVIHFSRVGRSSRESQFLSLSRVRFIDSRQPAQACQQLRDERFESNFAQIARAGFPDSAATERFTCFRMAMLNQLHSLRSWDIGGWVLGERQRAQSLLELAARGDIRFVTSGILALRNSLGVPKKRGEYPHFDRAVELLDALPEEERRAIAKDLIASTRIAWPGANRVLSELSDAIPSDVLPEFARWNAQLELDEYHERWARAWSKCWGDLLSWSDDAADLIEILKPALVVKAADGRCWDELHGTLCAGVIKGREATAHEILATLIAAPCEQPHFDQFRYSILLNVVRHRPELGQSAKQWLQAYVEREQRTTQDQYQLFALRHVDSVAEVEIDDSAFRDWVRLRVLENCQQRLEERGPTVHFGLIQFHPMMLQLTWPHFEADLVKNLFAVVDADYVPFVNKADTIACLAILASRCPAAESTEIVNAGMRWLNDGIKGRDLGHTSPLSTGQMRGAGPGAILSAFAFLLEAIAERHFDLAGEKLAKWIIAEGIRRPMVVVDHTLRTAFHCSIGMRHTNEPLAVALVGIAEGVANAVLLSEPQKTVHGFSDVVLNSPLPTEVREWVSTSAGTLCLDLWQRRLVEVSQIARPSAREAAAMAIRRWEKSGLELPQSLAEARDRLASDCRLRVRKAVTS